MKKGLFGIPWDTSLVSRIMVSLHVGMKLRDGLRESGNLVGFDPVPGDAETAPQAGALR